MSVFEANLPLPPRLKKDTLRVVPLGGLGEVGRNMTVYEINGKLLIVDCGVLFPEESQPGVDLILPDFSYIVDRLDDVVAMVLTHGHEDHIGAVPYLLRRRPDIPLVGSELTLALVEAKLAEHRIKPYTLAVKEHQVERFGPFECEFVAVNHSIPDALAVYIRTKAGKVLHTGDFKMDQLPLDGRITDLRPFARPGAEGVAPFPPAANNAEPPRFTPTEKHIGPVLSNVFRDASGRIIVASFSSHVHRVQQVLDAAAERGRKVVLVGRSMVRNMTIAEKLGYLKVPANVLVDLKKVDDYRPDQIEVMIGQLVNLVKDGKPVRMSKRAGTVVTLEDLVEAVGVDAARYELTRYSVDTPIDIDLGLLTSKSNENPVYYVQYAHARTAAVARNAAEAGVKVEDGVDTSLLDSAADGELLAVLGQFPAAVRDAAKFYEPHRVNRYLEQLASAYHSWYGVSRVTPKADEEVTDLHRTRLLLNNAAQQVLANGLNLLGVSAPERM